MQAFWKAIICYIHITGKYLISEGFFQVRCLCRIRSVFLCVGGIILFFLLMIWPGCLQSGFCYKKTTKNIITLPLQNKVWGYILYANHLIPLSLRPSVCLCNRVWSKFVLLRKFLFHTKIVYNLGVFHDFDPRFFGQVHNHWKEKCKFS